MLTKLFIIFYSLVFQIQLPQFGFGIERDYIVINNIQKDSVQDSETAIAIAIAAWKLKFGSKIVEEQGPYVAYLGGNGIWYVRGSYPKFIPGKPAIVGGTLRADILQSDGTILHLYREK